MTADTSAALLAAALSVASAVLRCCPTDTCQRALPGPAWHCLGCVALAGVHGDSYHEHEFQ